MLGSVFISVGFNLVFNITYFELCFNLNFLFKNSLLKIIALIHTVLFHVYLKIKATKIASFINMA
jgi:hypothetical protein